MKPEIFVEYDGKQVCVKDLEVIAKNQWTEEGGKVKDIKSMSLYFKPNENSCYVVVNGEGKGSFQI